MSVGTLCRSAAFGLTCAAALASCSNAPDRQVTIRSMANSVFNGDDKNAPPTAQQVAAQAATAMASTDAPLIIVSLPKRKVVAVMQQIELNNGNATYGTQDRRAVTLRAGMINATRGLGNDVMSADISAVHALVSGRQNGTGRRVMRYLDGEDLTRVEVSNCTIRIGAAAHLQLAEIDTPVTAVSETCQGDGGDFTNSYQVAPNGRIVQSRQWHSPLNGYLTIQSLR
ncbi:YjbF family lipoprotein [Roseovarius arcticus]|uniref:YjbF family lipoprotein n=1 Tax=Roseovarius arcticus TaxID=2547404 RepID=UPI001110EBAD|nr:YjbF family lipoprotein [Roseovarius arcticus]